MMNNKLTLMTVLSFLFLSGCSENGFFFRSNSEYEDTPVKSVYYVGSPYRIKGVLYTPKEDDSYNEKGLAAWYTKDDTNRLTTNGEVFDDGEMTAAHKTLPLPSLVRITNLENGNTAIVRVNDRGPMVNNRLIDVSQKTAEALEFPETGTTLVQVEILPGESRLLREKLERYIEPQTNEIDYVPMGESRPIYKPDEDHENTIYNGSETVVEDSVEETPQEEIETKAEQITPVSGHYIQIGVFSDGRNAQRVFQNLSPSMPVKTVPSGSRTMVLAGPFENQEEARKMLDKVHQSGYSDAWVKFIK